MQLLYRFNTEEVTKAKTHCLLRCPRDYQCSFPISRFSGKVCVHSEYVGNVSGTAFGIASFVEIGQYPGHGAINVKSCCISGRVMSV